MSSNQKPINIIFYHYFIGRYEGRTSIELSKPEKRRLCWDWYWRCYCGGYCY